MQDSEGTADIRDGRADTLEAQAHRPLFAPHEMANASVGDFAAGLAHSASADLLRDRFGPDIFNDPQGALNVAAQAIAAYERSAAEFHPYSSKYDRVLRHEATLTPSEAHGLDVFNDKKKGNCASCHTSRIGDDGTPPAFTNRTYDSLGLPRNMAIPANAKPTYFDQGLCGPFRTDLVNNKESCGQFKVPTLRNVATRQVFFHNAAFTSLHDAVTFYAQRDIHPENYYPKGPDGQVQKFNDSPPFAGSNANRTDVPYDRNPGDEPAMNAQDIDDVVAFLNTLTDADNVSSSSKIGRLADARKLAREPDR